MGDKYMIHLLAPLLVNRMAKSQDIVVDNIAHAVPWWSPLVTRKPVIGVVYHVHQAAVSIELPFPLNMVVRSAEKSIKYAYDDVVTISYSTKRDLVHLLRMPERKIKVIHPGVDHELYRPRNEKFHKPTILWLGRIKKYKNLDHLLMAFDIIKKRISDARLIIAGSGDYEADVRKLDDELGLKDVIFMGKVKEGKKLELLRKSWTLAITSITEGWGISVLEAAACATTAVGYNSGAIKEAVLDERTGLLAKYGDIEELADKIYLILMDKKFRDKLSKGALEYSYNFDWDKTSNEALRVMKEATEFTH
jgi:glycosyltransferase involved in cell wall biosynthesis